MEAGAILNIQNSPAAFPYPFYTTRLYPGGGTLMISNNPEEVNGQGILYQDRLRGAWRVCVHHQNKTGSEPGGIPQSIRLLIILTNPGSAIQTIVVERSGVGVHGDPQIAGCRAVRQFLANNVPGRQRISPGQSLSWGVDKLNFGDTFSGLYDFCTAAELDVSVATLFVEHQSLSTEDLSFFQRHKNPDGSFTIRGTFPYRELHGRLLYYAGAGWRGIQLGNNPYGNYMRDPWWDWVWSQVCHGEYPAGWNALDRETVYNWGNYGVFYHLDCIIEHHIAHPQCARILFNPRGGTYYGPLQAAGALLCPLEPVAPLTEAVLLKNIETSAGMREQVPVSFMPAGGSSLPVRILLGSV
jgi:hypothetical protein